MNKTVFIFIVFIFISLQSVNAQSAGDRAKAYYFEAATSFEKRDYQKTLNYCKEVESILGASNARVEALRIKSYYELGNISEAKQALNRFSSFKADETLTKEISPYIVKIEEKEEYNRTHTSCSYCYGSGKEEEKIACGSCNGMGTEKYYNDCSWCKGSGRNAHGSECVMCGGDGKGGTQYRSCSSCQGSGSGGTRTKTCTVCYGKGDVQIIE